MCGNYRMLGLERIAVVTVLLAAAPAARGGTIRVPAEQPTIQAGIDAAQTGDTVLVAAGGYLGAGNRDIDFRGKRIIVRSERGPAECVINCAAGAGDPHRGFYFHTNESPETILEGFTIKNGYSPTSPVGQRGGAILCIGSSPTIRHCTIRNCAADVGGGGLANMSGSSPAVIGCAFVANDAGRGNGGGIFNRFSSSPTVIGCSFSGNASGHVGGALSSRDDSNPVAVNCSFVGNGAQLWGGAVRAGYDSATTLIGCTFSANSAVSAGGAVSAGSDTNVPLRTTRLIDCILWENSSPLGPQIALLGNFPAEIAVSFSDVMGGQAGVYVKNGFRLTWGEGNIDADPLLIRAPHPGADNEWGTKDDDYGDLRVRPPSRCIDAADNDAFGADSFDLDRDGDRKERIPVDLAEHARFQDDPGTVDTGRGICPLADMGAFEFQTTGGCCLRDPQWRCDGDVDGDGQVNPVDAGLVQAAYGSSDEQALCNYDLDCDGQVNPVDHGIVESLFGTCGKPRGPCR